MKFNQLTKGQQKWTVTFASAIFAVLGMEFYSLVSGNPNALSLTYIISHLVSPDIAIPFFAGLGAWLAHHFTNAYEEYQQLPQEQAAELVKEGQQIEAQINSQQEQAQEQKTAPQFI